MTTGFCLFTWGHISLLLTEPPWTVPLLLGHAISLIDHTPYPQFTHLH